ncbi:MAG: hypothetical protein ACP5GK_08120 [Desulfurella sp.]|uniref:hypothetical protein n=1 Tax=Desulfurella sp. TaxID=1962857 RepID=UPI003D0E1629
MKERLINCRHATCQHSNGPMEIFFEDNISFDINSKGMLLNNKSKFYSLYTAVLKSYFSRAVKTTIKTLTKSIEFHTKSYICSTMKSGAYKVFYEIEPIIESAPKLCKGTINCLTKAQVG